MYCPECGEENTDGAKFCKSCGAPLESGPDPVSGQKTYDKNKIIIIALIAVIAILAVGAIFAGGFLKGNVPLETMDFEVFKMDVPVGSEFVTTNTIPNYGFGGFIGMSNSGKYSKEVGSLLISTIAGSSHPDAVKLDRTEGDIKIFKDTEGRDAYYITREVDDYEFVLIGSDDKTMIKMLKTVKITDEDELASQSSSESSSSSSASSAPASSTPSSISILGGSFSTGSADADKTYARINVGTAHAGEDVIVQIFYSRDGNSLNNGNMVPATVHSDGYLEIASADAYKYYPDYATIKIYDSNSHLLTTQSVSLSPSAGTQTF
ncbi:MAG: zinc ribbon domain-containing protein [Methanobrevibacter sp.]|uniref:zinc ribbon domain-containing protein n=1 Tax=Methanobrevibacter sp. TaxID=66852 RepID=UPI002E7A91DD|nr:zinc ribbon domain-containing protein [Methanobrevibacter sp.]MEE0936203.1 zinc ribbon domain-containing protein [Methanobrevibacter sp.]